MATWFEHTVEGAEFDLLIMGEWEVVTVGTEPDPEEGWPVPVHEDHFTCVEAAKVFDTGWEDLSKEEALRLLEEHKETILEEVIDRQLPAD